MKRKTPYFAYDMGNPGGRAMLLYNHAIHKHTVNTMKSCIDTSAPRTAQRKPTAHRKSAAAKPSNPDPSIMFERISSCANSPRPLSVSSLTPRSSMHTPRAASTAQEEILTNVPQSARSLKSPRSASVYPHIHKFLLPSETLEGVAGKPPRPKSASAASFRRVEYGFEGKPVSLQRSMRSSSMRNLTHDEVVNFIAPERFTMGEPMAAAAPPQQQQPQLHSQTLGQFHQYPPPIGVTGNQGNQDPISLDHQYKPTHNVQLFSATIGPMFRNIGSFSKQERQKFEDFVQVLVKYSAEDVSKILSEAQRAAAEQKLLRDYNGTTEAASLAKSLESSSLLEVPTQLQSYEDIEPQRDIG